MVGLLVFDGYKKNVKKSLSLNRLEQQIHNKVIENTVVMKKGLINALIDCFDCLLMGQTVLFNYCCLYDSSMKVSNQ